MFVLFYHRIEYDGPDHWDDMGVDIIGPFATREEAEAFQRREDIRQPSWKYGLKIYSIEEVRSPSKLEPPPIPDPPPGIFPK